MSKSVTYFFLWGPSPSQVGLYMATSNKRFSLEGPGPPDPLNPLLPTVVVERRADCSGVHSEFVFHTPEPFTDKKV